MRVKINLLARIAFASLCFALPASAAEPLTLNGYIALRGPKPTEHIACGPAPQQYVEWFEPSGSAPFPVGNALAAPHGQDDSRGHDFPNFHRASPQTRSMSRPSARNSSGVRP